MTELVPQVSQFHGKPVTFISLSIGGWDSGESPTSQFLKEWKDKFNIPFPVAASPRDAGKDFWSKPHIPNVVIIDANGNLFSKGEAPEVASTLEKVRQALGSSSPEIPGTVGP